MKTFSSWYIRNFDGVQLKTATIGLVLLVACCCGCGPSLKQYAINEALLIDQTRILENEIYRTRYELQQTLRENQQLRSRLGIEKKSSNSLGTESDNPDAKSNATDNMSFDVPVVPANVKTSDLDLLKKKQSDPKKMIPENAVPPSGTNANPPNPVPSPTTSNEPKRILVIPTTRASNEEELPQNIIVPRSKTQKSAIPVSRTTEAAQSSPHTVPALRQTDPIPFSPSSISPPIYQKNNNPQSNTNSVRPTGYTKQEPSDDWSPIEKK